MYLLTVVSFVLGFVIGSYKEKDNTKETVEYLHNLGSTQVTIPDPIAISRPKKPSKTTKAKVIKRPDAPMLEKRYKPWLAEEVAEWKKGLEQMGVLNDDTSK